MALAVFLKILAVIGWILLGLLALILLILLIVLLVPIRYQADVHGTKEIRSLAVHARVNWLLRMIGFNMCFEDKTLDAILRIVWKKIQLTGEDREPEEEEDSEESGKPELASAHTSDAAGHEEKRKKQSESHAAHLITADATAKERKQEKNKTRERRFTFDKICDTINEIRFAKEDILAFLSAKPHQKIFRHAVRRLKKLGRKVLPSRLDINGEIGFEDPYTTSLVCAILSAIYPKSDKIRLPDLNFEEQVVDLDGYLKGKLRIGSFVAFILPLLLNINLYRTIKDFKAFKKRMEQSAEVIKGGKAA